MFFSSTFSNVCCLVTTIQNFGINLVEFDHVINRNFETYKVLLFVEIQKIIKPLCWLSICISCAIIVGIFLGSFIIQISTVVLWIICSDKTLLGQMSGTTASQIGISMSNDTAGWQSLFVEDLKKIWIGVPLTTHV